MAYSTDIKIKLAQQADKVVNALTIQTNGTTRATYNGSAAATVNITAATVGAAASSHTHNYAGSNEAGGGATYNYLPRVSNTADYGLPLARGAWLEFASGADKNLPTNAFYHIFTGQSSDTSYTTQLALGMTTTNIAYRNRYAGTWGAWNTVLTSANYKTYCTPANIGAALSSHTHSYLPLGGGTLTGTLNTQLINVNSAIEISAPTPYIDFHFNKSTTDYSARIISDAANKLSIHAESGVSISNGIILTGILQTTNEIWQTVGGTTWEHGGGCGTGDVTIFGLRCRNSSRLFQFTSAGELYTPSNIIVSGGRIRCTTNATAGTTAAANGYFDSEGVLFKSSSSSQRYKHNITKKISESLNPEKLYELPVVQYQYKPNYVESDPEGTKLHIGFIVEDVAEVYPAAVDYNIDGSPEMWNYKEILPGMLKLIQDQHKTQLKQEETIKNLMDRIEQLEPIISQK